MGLLCQGLQVRFSGLQSSGHDVAHRTNPRRPYRAWPPTLSWLSFGTRSRLRGPEPARSRAVDIDLRSRQRTDPTREKGDLLHPANEPVEVLREIKKSMGPMLFSAQYQQAPEPAGGKIRSTTSFTRTKPDDVENLHDGAAGHARTDRPRNVPI